ncbi:TPA: DUF3265 domain-containing protein [Vibrio parahaemolyticus]|nr:DUF3265 domain-containing protein [Vibrio parahaemolyticus]HCJ4668946.1 DUF3265 domain-containing protein [Vibrio parahaemolyticus]HCM0852254.1 DUF3265 domain-containing protein [Vibrio parahaemolyticus]
MRCLEAIRFNVHQQTRKNGCKASVSITKRSSAIRNAWQFLSAVSKVFKAQCGCFGIALLTP